MCIERGHEDERDINTLGSVEVLDLADGKVEECHVVFDLEGTLRTSHTYRKSIQKGRFNKARRMHTHGSTEAAIHLENGQFAESGRVLGLREGAVRHDLVIARGLDAVPVPIKVGQRCVCDEKKKEANSS